MSTFLLPFHPSKIAFIYPRLESRIIGLSMRRGIFFISHHTSADRALDTGSLTRSLQASTSSMRLFSHWKAEMRAGTRAGIHLCCCFPLSRVKTS